MTRLGTRDRLLFLGLSGLFLACWLLHVNVLLKGGIGWIPVQVAAPSVPVSSILEHMKIDKKVQSGRIRLVLLRRVGEAFLTADYPDAALHTTVQPFFA